MVNDWEWHWHQFSDLPNCNGEICDWFIDRVETVASYIKLKMAEGSMYDKRRIISEFDKQQY